MKEEDIPKLSNEEIQKIERITEAFKKREEAKKNRLDAEANLESQKKWRIVFERALKETIPFIIYVVYCIALVLSVLLNIIHYTDVRLWVGASILILALVAPLFVLPNINWKNLFRHLKNKITGKNEETLPIT
jgi:Flp pilus assembly protein TadB